MCYNYSNVHSITMFMSKTKKTLVMQRIKTLGAFRNYYTDLYLVYTDHIAVA